MSVDVNTNEEVYPRPSLRRIILPIVLVAGTFLCGYAALFVGVKEDLPAPTTAARYPLSIANQNIIKNYWAENTKDYRTLDISVYIMRDTPEQAIQFWKTAFVDRRGWRAIETPAQPTSLESVGFQMYSYRRVTSKVILAIAPADKLLALDNEFTKIIKPANYKPGDTVALMIVGDLK